MPETEQQQPSQEAAQAATTDEPAGAVETDWQAEARKWEKRAKENHKRVQELEPKAGQFDALEAASKTELERAQEQITQLQSQATENERRALIASVALDKGLPPTLARRLQGDTKDDLEADADELLAQFQQQANSGPRAPRVDPSQGSSAGRSAASNDPAQQFASIIRGQLGS